MTGIKYSDYSVNLGPMIQGSSALKWSSKYIGRIVHQKIYFLVNKSYFFHSFRAKSEDNKYLRDEENPKAKEIKDKKNVE